MTYKINSPYSLPTGYVEEKFRTVYRQGIYNERSVQGTYRAYKIKSPYSLPKGYVDEKVRTLYRQGIYN